MTTEEQPTLEELQKAAQEAIRRYNVALKGWLNVNGTSVSNETGERIVGLREHWRMTHDAFVAYQLAEGAHVGTALPERVDQGAVAVARVDHGRWVANCPRTLYCSGAEFVDPQDETPRFYCFSCHNSEWSGQYIAVEFPEAAQREAIEAALLERPHERFRHWHPELTVADLQTENALHAEW